MKQLFIMLLAAASICQVCAQSSTPTQTNLSKTEFGVMAAGVKQSQADAKVLGVKLIRNRVMVTNSTGLKQMTSGFDYITNFVWNGKSLPKDLKDYEKRLRSLVALMKVKPKYAVIENEENLYNNMPLYCAQLAVAKKVFSEFGIPVINGGITRGAAVDLVCAYYSKHGQTSTAEYLAKRNPIGRSVNLKDLQYEIAFMAKDSSFKYYFYHYQLKDSTYAKDAQLISNALRAITGKMIGDNERAQQDESLNTTTAMVQSGKADDIIVLYIITGKDKMATTFDEPMKQAAGAAIAKK